MLKRLDTRTKSRTTNSLVEQKHVLGGKVREVLFLVRYIIIIILLKSSAQPVKRLLWNLKVLGSIQVLAHSTYVSHSLAKLHCTRNRITADDRRGASSQQKECSWPEKYLLAVRLILEWGHFNLSIYLLILSHWGKALLVYNKITTNERERQRGEGGKVNLVNLWCGRIHFVRFQEGRGR